MFEMTSLEEMKMDSVSGQLQGTWQRKCTALRVQHEPDEWVLKKREIEQNL